VALARGSTDLPVGAREVGLDPFHASRQRLMTGTWKTAAGSRSADGHEQRPELRNDEFEWLEPVTDLMEREHTYRRFLGYADGFAALATIMVIGEAGFRAVFFLCPLLAILVAKVQGLYDRDDSALVKSTLGEWRGLLRAATLTGIGSYLIYYASTPTSAGRGLRLFALLVFGDFALALVARLGARRFACSLTSEERCLIVGNPERCESLAQRVEAIEGVDLIGTISAVNVDCSVDGVRELVEHFGVQRIIVGPHSVSKEESVLDLIQSAKWLGVRVSLMPTVMTVVGKTTTVDQLDSIVLLGVSRFGLSRSSLAVKRTLDLVLGGLLLVLAAPLMIVIALAVRLTSPGPALFKQERIGRHGKPFTIYKFRSMVNDAEQLKASLTERNETSGLFKLENDPRVTRLGRVLRKTYLDELPQLWNVMRGDMSLVGPRPLIHSEDALLTGYDRHRLRLIPGMTGPWQLRGPLNASLAELARLDYLYASNWSVWADIDILLGTAARVVNRHGH
jgi:exopolysaccharide biosynthesis polyprenyl glycosylphosphotransferase